MSVQITIRNVSDEVRNAIAARAAQSGKSMQEYLKDELVRLASRPSLDEWLNKVQKQKELKRRKLGADVILAHRDADRR